jgi:hypothetical protein
MRSDSRMVSAVVAILVGGFVGMVIAPALI